jgi:signal transduction histidine kinase
MLVIVGLGLPVSLAVYLSDPASFKGDPAATFLSYGVLAAVYAGVRSRYGEIALWALVVVGTVAVWGTLAGSATRDEFLLGSPLALLTFVLGAFLPSAWGLVVVSSLSVAGLAAVAVLVPGVTGTDAAACAFLVGLPAAGVIGIQAINARDRRDLAIALRNELEARAAAVDAEEARLRFLSVAHHELRTPLNGVLGATEFLLSEDLHPDTRALVEAAHQSGQRLHGLVEDLLVFVDHHNGELSIADETVDVAALVREVGEQHRREAERRRLELTVEAEGQVEVQVDGARVRQIVRHLVANAVRFTRSGTVRLRVENEGGRCRIEVQDTGPGMTHAELERAFLPLTQLSEGRARESEGMGLGLATSRALAHALGATLTAISTTGRGSTFRLDLPRVPRDGVGRAA